jgi:hypothetical protein
MAKAQSRFDEAVAEGKRAEELEPHSPISCAASNCESWIELSNRPCFHS